MTGKPAPTNPIDCFTDEQKQWAVEKLKEELPQEWQRLVNQQLENRRIHRVPDEERSLWALDGLNVREVIESLPFDFGDDGWERNRCGTIVQALTEVAIKETFIQYPTSGPDKN